MTTLVEVSNWDNLDYCLEQVQLDYANWQLVPNDLLTEELLSIVVKHDGKILFKVNKNKRTVKLYDVALKQVYEANLRHSAEYQYVRLKDLMSEILEHKTVVKSKAEAVQMLDLAIWGLGQMRSLLDLIPDDVLKPL